MSATSDAVSEPPRHGPTAPSTPLPGRESLTDEELVWSLLADLGDAAVGLPVEHALAAVEVFNLVAEVVRPRRLVADPTRSIPELIDQASEVLDRLADAATRAPLVARYITAQLQLRDLADQLANHCNDRPGFPSQPS
jgi:hypothetical protein